MADYDALDIRLHGASIGTLARLGRDRIVFAFDRGYARDRARPVLSLSFRDPFGHLITDIPPTRTWAPPFFSNLLAFVDDDRMALELLNGARRFADLSEALLRRLASSARVPQAMVVGAARRTVERFMSVWGEAGRDPGMPSDAARAIDAHLPRLPLVSAHFSSR